MAIHGFIPQLQYCQQMYLHMSCVLVITVPSITIKFCTNDFQYALATLTACCQGTVTKMQAAVVLYYNRLQPSSSKHFQILNYIILALKAKKHITSFVF